MNKVKVTMLEPEDFLDADHAKEMIIEALRDKGYHIQIVDIEYEDLGVIQCPSCDKWGGGIFRCDHCGEERY